MMKSRLGFLDDPREGALMMYLLYSYLIKWASAQMPPTPLIGGGGTVARQRETDSKTDIWPFASQAARSCTLRAGVARVGLVGVPFPCGAGRTFGGAWQTAALNAYKRPL